VNNTVVFNEIDDYPFSQTVVSEVLPYWQQNATVWPVLSFVTQCLLLSLQCTAWNLPCYANTVFVFMCVLLLLIVQIQQLSQKMKIASSHL